MTLLPSTAVTRLGPLACAAAPAVEVRARLATARPKRAGRRTWVREGSHGPDRRSGVFPPGWLLPGAELDTR
jgi:hypothetical protein